MCYFNSFYFKKDAACMGHARVKESRKAKSRGERERM
jgi:hypothetical protein